jgi:hypothetical protein
MPRPIPEFDPVMTAVLPLSCMMLILLLDLQVSLMLQLQKGQTRLIVQGSVSKKKRRHEADVKLLRQVSYRQETYRAVPSL